MSDIILDVQNLRTSFPNSGGRVAVVEDISFQIKKGEVLALVGESGCGKSISAMSIMRLVPKPGLVEPTSRLMFEGRNLLDLDVPEMRKVRGGDIGMIFQEPMSSLNPVQTVGAQVVEAILLHVDTTKEDARQRTIDLFKRVGIPDPAERFDAFPHQLSGGLKQRVVIAMAIAMRPKILIADEPTTALDVTIQAQIIDLLRELQSELETSILLITHDLAVVNELADRIAVMYAGRLVETATRQDLFQHAAHPYTQGLLRAIPGLAKKGERLHEIEGVVPPPHEWPIGCRFASRCPIRLPHCADQPAPEVVNKESHVTFCHALNAEVTS